MAQLTFKNYPKLTGLSRIGGGERGADIKLKGKIIGFISPSNRYRKSCLAFLKVKRDVTVEDPCPFENKAISFIAKDVEEMKEYLKNNSEEVIKGLDLYISDKE